MTELKTTLSASKIKTAESCSWLYWCKYVLKLPDASNDGARRGGICHLVFEVLGRKRHKKHFSLIMKKGDLFASKAVERLVLKHARREGVDDEDNLLLIKEMTFNGLSYDFFGLEAGRPTQALSEQSFEIVHTNGDVSYKIRGYIDKLFLYKKQKFALIRDFKSSKGVFQGKEVSDNMQDFMYSLAVKHLFPEYSQRESQFVFLKFDLNGSESEDGEGLIRMTQLSDDDLYGFELQLTETQKYLDRFSIKDATKNMAAFKPFPTDKSFSGRLLCGFAKEKGELKKDGTPKWHCGMKFDFFYYEILNRDGEVIKAVLEDGFEESMVPEGGSYEMKFYPGCPAFCN